MSEAMHQAYNVWAKMLYKAPADGRLLDSFPRPTDDAHLGGIDTGVAMAEAVAALDQAPLFFGVGDGDVRSKQICN